MTNPTKQLIAKDDLIRVANINIADSNYAVDVAALRGFCLGIGIHPSGLTMWLKNQLGDSYPTELPDYWLFAEGL